MNRRVSKAGSGEEWVGIARVVAEALLGGSGLNWDSEGSKGAGLRKNCSGRSARVYLFTGVGNEEHIRDKQQQIGEVGRGGGAECWVPFWPVEPVMTVEQTGREMGPGTGRAVALRCCETPIS